MPHVSRQSGLSANDKGDNKIISVVVHRSPGICLKSEENPENPSKETVDEGCATSHRLKWGLLLPNEVGRIAQHVRNREGREMERT